MQQIPWKNITAAHPKGVCEAATTIWLAKIVQSNINSANNILGTDCDSLQAECERGIYTWAVSLKDYLGGESKATFNAWVGPVITSAADLESQMNIMKDNDFFIISAANPDGDGHSVAGYRKAGMFYLFDPNWAIYLSTDVKALAEVGYNNLSVWQDLAMRKGTFKG